VEEFARFLRQGDVLTVTKPDRLTAGTQSIRHILGHPGAMNTVLCRH
jgi:hypothetical protein